jgi:hypothetical protein
MLGIGRRATALFILGLILGFGILRLWPVGVGLALVGFGVALLMNSQERATLAGSYLLGVALTGIALLAPIVLSSTPCTSSRGGSCYSRETVPTLVGFAITGSVGLLALVLSVRSSLKARR